MDKPHLAASWVSVASMVREAPFISGLVWKSPTAHEPLFHCPVTCVGREIVLLLRQLKWILKGESSPALFWETILAVLVPWALRETVGIPRNFTHRRCPSCIHLEHSIALARL